MRRAPDFTARYPVAPPTFIRLLVTFTPSINTLTANSFVEAFTNRIRVLELLLLPKPHPPRNIVTDTRRRTRRIEPESFETRSMLTPKTNWRPELGQMCLSVVDVATETRALRKRL